MSKAVTGQNKRDLIVGSTLLAVEDDEAHRKLIELLAKRLKISAYTAKSCEEASELLETFAFDVILMDCRLPLKSGLECTRLIRGGATRSAHSPIIAFTADLTPENRQKCREHGMDDFLAKPFTLAEFEEKIWRWLSIRD